MNQPISRRSSLRYTLGALMSAPMCLRAQSLGTWPSRPIKIVVPYPAGGAPDGFSRAVAESLSAQFPGTSVVVDNKPGASGLLGVRAVSQAPADQHTLAYVASGHVTLAAMNPRYQMLKELRPVARMSAAPFVVLVSSQSPYKSLPELIRFAQANPGKLNCGTAGPASAAHLAVEYLEESTKDFKTTLVPFKGAVESIQAIVGGQIDMTIGVLGAALPLIRAGKLRALAVTTPKRVAVLPDVPTVAEAGGGDYAFTAWGGFMMHPDTSADIVGRMNQALNNAMQSEVVQRYIATTGGLPDVSASPEAFGVQIARDIVREQAIVKRLGMSIEQ